jgi:hypothetical protein
LTKAFAILGNHKSLIEKSELLISHADNMLKDRNAGTPFLGTASLGTASVGTIIIIAKQPILGLIDDDSHSSQCCKF